MQNNYKLGGIFLNKREKLLKHFKVIAILFVISIIFEGVIYAYNIFINKFYNQKNLTGNTPIEISNSELEFSEIDNLFLKYKDVLDQ